MRWMWIDRIVELVPRERLVAIKHVSLAEDHLSDHFAATPTLPAQPIMPASLIIEGMAQTAGILVGHAARFNENVILAKIQKARLDADATPGATLRYTATIQRLDQSGAATLGAVELIEPGADPETIGQIDLMFSHVDQSRTDLKLPEHNFVFSESFQTLLKLSGIKLPAE